MIAILLAMLTVQAAPAPKLSDIAGLSQRAAGELVLRGEPHAPIAAVEPRPRIGLMFADESELALVERPVATPQGCIRGRWIVVFLPDRSSNDASPRVNRARKDIEIARSTRRGCADAAYVTLAHGMTPIESFTTLATLERVRDPRTRVGFECVDVAETGLCAGESAIRRAISELTAWLILRKAGEDLVWLGDRGRIVTELRFDRATPDRVVVDRRIPAPA